MRMEMQNQENWRALIQCVDDVLAEDVALKARIPSLPNRPWNVLDIGCHTGGLLEAIQARRGWTNISVNGVEPLKLARQKAIQKFPNGCFFEKLEQVPPQSMDLVVSHETLYLIDSLEDFSNQLMRILRPDGGAFIALGSHAENTAWMRWRAPLREKYGHVSYAHQPMDIQRIGEEAGFDVDVRQLHPPSRTKPKRYNPPEDGWGEFLSTKEMLEHREQKLVFGFWPKSLAR